MLTVGNPGSTDGGITVDFLVSVHTVNGVSINGQSWVFLFDLKKLINHWLGGLSKLHCNWSWLISDQVLEGTTGDIFSKKGGNVVGITSGLGKFDSNWCWFVNYKVFKGSNRNIVVKEGETGSGTMGLSKFSGDWSWLIDDEVLESGDGDIVVKKSKTCT
jgi:hypothetical protein